MGVNVYDYDAMRRAMGEIEDTATRLRSINWTMTLNTNDLAKAYTGGSGTKYHQLMSSWGKVFDDITTQLALIHKSLGENLRSNIRNEEENSPMIARVQSALK